jgi:hypothetical protein
MIMGLSVSVCSVWIVVGQLGTVKETAELSNASVHACGETRLGEIPSCQR